MKLISILALSILCGCSVSYYSTPTGAKLFNGRSFWNNEGLNVTISTNGTATLKSSSSGTDSEQLGTLIGTAIKTSR